MSILLDIIIHYQVIATIVQGCIFLNTLLLCFGVLGLPLYKYIYYVTQDKMVLLRHELNKISTNGLPPLPTFLLRDPKQCNFQSVRLESHWTRVVKEHEVK